MSKDEAEAEFVRQLCTAGVARWYVMCEHGNFYYCFDVKNGRQRFWTNIRESNLRKILDASGIPYHNLAQDVSPRRRVGGDDD